MKKSKGLDLYTALILVCVVLLPVCGWWCYQTRQKIDAAEKAAYEATKRGGYLEEIGALQKQVDLVNNNRSGDVSQPGTYFETQILVAGGGKLGTTDFSVKSPSPEFLTLPGTKQKATDYVVEIQWTNKDLQLKLDFIDALLWNCESGAGPGGSSNLQSIWKLRELEIENITVDKGRGGYKTPPPELDDRWQIRKMKFARREPPAK